MENYQIMLTPAALLDFLTQISELDEYDISVSETGEGDIAVNIGDSCYMIDSSHAEDIEVPDAAVEEAADINDDAFEDIVDSSDDFESVDVEGGLIYETLKTLAIGGLARLAGKAAKDALR